MKKFLAFPSKNPRFLVFNVTGCRDSAKMLQILHDNIQFEEVIFVPNVASLKKDSTGKGFTYLSVVKYANKTINSSF
jgi:hypothetical protein